MSTPKLCECGCGRRAPIAQKNYPKFGHVKGQPMRFCRGHYLKLYPLTKGYRRPPIEERFWKHVDKSGDCWTWTGSVSGNGYGAIRYNGKQTGAHRVAWILAYGDIPNGMVVRHSCDNPLCVRIDHLSLGTVVENSQDMVERNRASRIGPKSPAQGERNGSAILTESNVRTIRKEHSAGKTTKALARQFNVSVATVQHIVARLTWKHVE